MQRLVLPGMSTLLVGYIHGSKQQTLTAYQQDACSNDRTNIRTGPNKHAAKGLQAQGMQKRAAMVMPAT
jgi:hypothetical protein